MISNPLFRKKWSKNMDKNRAKNMVDVGKIGYFLLNFF
jgi:hypothetical protein